MADVDDHKTGNLDCKQCEKARKVVQRAAQLLRDMWIEYRMAFYEDKVDRVCIRNVYDRNEGKGDTGKGPKRNLLVYDSPTSDHEEKPAYPIDPSLAQTSDDLHAVISAKMCSLATLVLKYTAEKMFEDPGIDPDIMQVNHTIKNCRLWVSHVGPLGMHSDPVPVHSVLKVSLRACEHSISESKTSSQSDPDKEDKKSDCSESATENITKSNDPAPREASKAGSNSGSKLDDLNPSEEGNQHVRPEAFAVDLTGAQFGWPESCMPWTQYERSRMQDLLDTQPLTRAAERVLGEIGAAADSIGPDGSAAVKHLLKLHGYGAQTMATVVDLWLANDYGWDGELWLQEPADKDKAKPKVEDSFSAASASAPSRPKAKAKSFAQLWDLPDDDFARQRENLLTTVRESMLWLARDKTLVKQMKL